MALATGKIRVMCLQETGEEFCIGYTNDLPSAEGMIDGHLDNHPEHHSAWTEDVVDPYAQAERDFDFNSGEEGEY